MARIDSLSAHADAAELTAWLSGAAAPARAYIVHGEPAAADAMRRTLGDELGWAASIAQHGERAELGAVVAR